MTWIVIAVLSLLIIVVVVVVILLFLRRKKKPTEYIYVSIEEVIEFNVLIMSRRGLLRDRPGLESAMMRPQMAAYYQKADIAEQAAVLIEGIAMAHPFIDGNKRTALIAGTTFLDINGYELRTANIELGEQIEQLVVTRDIDKFVSWMRSHVRSQ